MKKILSFILYSFYALILAGLAILFFVPPIPGLSEFEVKIVKSGSMEPTIMTGAVVVVQATPVYGVGDVITFSSHDSVIPTTHRIIGTGIADGKEYFVTKGDANEERDANLVSVSDILGKVMVDVPYLGFVLDFARQPVGFALLIGLPALLIILDELDNIWREVRRVRKIKITKEMIMPLVIAPYQPDVANLATLTTPVVLLKKPSVTVKARMMDIKPKVQKTEINPALQLKNKSPMFASSHDIKSRFVVATAGFVMMINLVGQNGIGDSLSYFSDTEASGVNNMEAQALDFSVSPENDTFVITDGVFDGGNSVEVDINDNDEKKDLSYVVSVDSVGSTTTLCDDILVNSTSPLAFSGSLPSLLGNNISFLDPWLLDFSLATGSDYVSGDTCSVNLVFAGYNGVSEDLGYVDTEHIVLNFTALKTEVLAPAQEENLSSFISILIVDESSSSTLPIIEEGEMAEDMVKLEEATTSVTEEVVVETEENTDVQIDTEEEEVLNESISTEVSG